MVFQGLGQAQAEAVWRPFLEWVAGAPDDSRVAPPVILAVPARSIWDPAGLRRFPGLVVADDRPGAPAENVFWAADAGQVGQYLHAYGSAWLPAALLRPAQRERLADALFAASRHWSLSLHVTGCSSCTTASAASAGARTASPGSPDPHRTGATERRPEAGRAAGRSRYHPCPVHRRRR